MKTEQQDFDAWLRTQISNGGRVLLHEASSQDAIAAVLIGTSLAVAIKQYERNENRRFALGFRVAESQVRLSEPPLQESIDNSIPSHKSDAQGFKSFIFRLGDFHGRVLLVLTASGLQKRTYELDF